MPLKPLATAVLPPRTPATVAAPAPATASAEAPPSAVGPAATVVLPLANKGGDWGVFDPTSGVFVTYTTREEALQAAAALPGQAQVWKQVRMRVRLELDE